MPLLIPGSVYVKGDQNEIVPQESTGELKTIAGGKHGEIVVSMALDSSGNQMNYDERDLFCKILCELRKINVHLSMMTDAEVGEVDLR